MPNKRRDITGIKYELLTAIRDVGKDKYGQRRWECKCDCGKLVKITIGQFGRTKSCGCLHSPDLTGFKTGMLEVIEKLGLERTGPINSRGQNWLCLCECGRTIKASTGYLLAGRLKSCGRCPKGTVRKTDFTGTKSGMLTVLRLTRRIGKGRWMCLCKCECGKETEIRVSQVVSNATRSCGCLQHRRFENNPRWKPDARETKRDRKCRPEYAIWRTKVFERDDYTCQICGGRNGSGKAYYLHAHHKEPWAICEPKRLDVDNGISLCKECHKEFHKKYGNSSTANDLKEFKMSRTV